MQLSKPQPDFHLDRDSFAAHRLLDQGLRIRHDPSARALASHPPDQALLDALDDLKSAITPVMRVAFALRHRFAEDKLARAWRAGNRQVRLPSPIQDVACASGMALPIR